jgi:hypothetical protein
LTARIDEPTLTLREEASQWYVILRSSRATFKLSVMQALYALQQRRIDPVRGFQKQLKS